MSRRRSSTTWPRRLVDWASARWSRGRLCARVTTPTRWSPAMHMPITLPELGLPPSHAVRLSTWYAVPGETVFEGDRLVEVLTEGATFDVPAPATGRLV